MSMKPCPTCLGNDIVTGWTPCAGCSGTGHVEYGPHVFVPAAHPNRWEGPGGQETCETCGTDARNALHQIASPKQVDPNNPIEALRLSCVEMGFELIHDPGDDDGAVKGHGRDFIGTIPEIRAFLFGWSGARNLTHEEDDQAKRNNRLVRSLLAAHSGMVTPSPHQPSPSIAFTVRPFTPFRGSRIAIPDDMVESFDIHDIRVGNRSQFRSMTGVPASFFAMRIQNQALLNVLIGNGGTPTRILIDEPASKEFGREIHLETCQVAQDLVVHAQLRRGAPASALVVIFMGKSAD